MRNAKTAYVMALTLILIVSVAGSSHAGLLASVYPGAIPADEELGEHERPYSRLFYAHDPIEQVVAFYEREMGSMEEVRSGREYQNVDRHPPRFLASLEPEIIGVRVFSSAPTEQRQPEMYAGVAEELMEMMPDRCNSEHFANLRIMAHRLDSYDWDNFREICDRFEHIDWAYFKITDEKDSRGRPVRKDQVLLAEQERSLGAGAPEDVAMDIEAMAERIEQLQRQGRFQEMAELARKMHESAMAGAGMDPGGTFQDNWDEWVAYLEKLDKHAYRTRIVIHRDPATWPDRPMR